MSEAELFGGAMCCALPGVLGKDFHDASRFRQVPDHQEMFMHERSGAAIIIELLSHQRHVADVDAAYFHWCELHSSNKARNEADRSQLVEETLEPVNFDTPHGPLLAVRTVASGIQRVSKFNEDDRVNDVMVSIGLLRLTKPYWTDVLVSISAPLRIAEGSSEQRYVEQPLEAEEAVAMVRTVFESVVIRDFGLFVEEE
mmetsp:Transcript_12311/g.38295  ORF Transcript_12311/g.38295 Transcript_12311/m.38295 type:complete len:199 (-) Transcript_12311:100-696(-)